MDHISLASKLHNLCVSVVPPPTPSVDGIAPTSARAQAPNFGFNEIALIVRLEKLVEKLKKMEKKKDVEGMMEIGLDVKAEIETAIGISISIESSLELIYKELQQMGFKPLKKQWETFTKKFKKKDKKNAHRVEYVSMILTDPNGAFNLNEEQLLYMAKKDHDKNKDQEEENLEIPASMALGITAALCGLFLMFLPIPQAKKWGAELVKYGIALAVEEGVRHNADEKDKDKDKKK